MAPSKSPFATKTFKLSNASRSFKEGRLRSVKKVKKSSTGPVGGEIVFNLDLEDPEGAQEPIETNKNSTSLEDEEEIHSAADDDDDADIDTSYLSNALEASLKSSSSQRRKSYDHPSRGYQAAQRTMGTSRKMRNLFEISERYVACMFTN